MSNPCWSCNLPLTPTTIFCEHCQKLQPLCPASAFERLDIGCSFDVDQSLLEQNYFRAQRLVHPDRFVAASKQEKLYSAQHSAAINDAYETLKSPISRAKELLKIAGFIQPNIEQQTLDDPELLMEVIELRENLLEVDSALQLEQLQGRLSILFDENTASLSKAFKDQNYHDAAKLLNRLRYLNKIRLEANQRRVA
jgi:molecular chaperone HscB